MSTQSSRSKMLWNSLCECGHQPDAKELTYL